jgi:3-oxoacyl-[acyl-carrier protein] reductase
MFSLHEKVAVVTGAMQGMGKADALALAAQGAHVAVTDLDLEKCQVVVDQIVSAGGAASAYVMDVTNRAQIDEVMGAVASSHGRLDILVNNAGIYEPKAGLELTEDEWDRTLAINLKGQFLCAQRAAVEMKKNTWGRIINISSIASGQTGVGVLHSAHYTASKGGVIGMTETLALEWAEFGITVNSIAPGAIDTPMAPESQLPEAQKQALYARIPLKRFGRPEEIAAAVVFFASEEAGYVVGATLFVDGGWLAG